MALPWVCLQCVIVIFPDQTHLFFAAAIAINMGNCFVSACFSAFEISNKLCIFFYTFIVKKSVSRLH